MVDATMPLERQDLTIARLVAQEGRALVVVLNKWDLIADPNAAMAEIRDTLTSPAGRCQGRAVRAALGADRPQRREAPARRGGRLQALGQPGLDRRAQSLAGRGAGAASAATGPGPPGQDPLRHPDHRPPADLRAVRQQAGRRAAGQLPALSGGGPARHLRSGRACRSASTSGTARTLTTRTDRAGRSGRVACIRAAAARPRRAAASGGGTVAGPLAGKACALQPGRHRPRIEQVDTNVGSRSSAA